MATIIRIKRSTGSIAPASLKTAEMAYTYGVGTTGNMGERLFIGTGDDGSANATSITVIGGSYFTDMLDHVKGTLTANSGVIVDSDKKIDQLLSGDIVIDGATNTITTPGKILYSNVYNDLADLPSASTYHGMFAHVHATGKGYFAHAGNWVPLANNDDLDSVTSALRSDLDSATTELRSDLDSAIAGISQTFSFTGDAGSDTVTLADSSLRFQGVAGQMLAVVTDNRVQLGLQATNVTPGNYGSTTKIPTIEVDNYGRIDSIGEASIELTGGLGMDVTTTPTGTTISQTTSPLYSTIPNGVVNSSAMSIPSLTIDSAGRIQDVSLLGTQVNIGLIDSLGSNAFGATFTAGGAGYNARTIGVFGNFGIKSELEITNGTGSTPGRMAWNLSVDSAQLTGAVSGIAGGQWSHDSNAVVLSTTDSNEFKIVIDDFGQAISTDTIRSTSGDTITIAPNTDSGGIIKLGTRVGYPLAQGSHELDLNDIALSSGMVRSKTVAGTSFGQWGAPFGSMYLWYNLGFGSGQGRLYLKNNADSALTVKAVNTTGSSVADIMRFNTADSEVRFNVDAALDNNKIFKFGDSGQGYIGRETVDNWLWVSNRNSTLGLSGSTINLYSNATNDSSKAIAIQGNLVPIYSPTTTFNVGRASGTMFQNAYFAGNVTSQLDATDSEHVVNKRQLDSGLASVQLDSASWDETTNTLNITLGGDLTPVTINEFDDSVVIYNDKNLVFGNGYTWNGNPVPGRTTMRHDTTDHYFEFYADSHTTEAEFAAKGITLIAYDPGYDFRSGFGALSGNGYINLDGNVVPAIGRGSSLYNQGYRRDLGASGTRFGTVYADHFNRPQVVDSGVYGSQTAIPVLTINSSGLVDSAGTVPLATTLNINADAGTGDVALLDSSIEVAGGFNVNTRVVDNVITVHLDSDILGFTSLTVDNVKIDGNTISSTDSSNTLFIDPFPVGDSGDLVIRGNLIVQGTQTTVNSSVVSLNDKNLVLADSAATAAIADGAGLTVGGDQFDSTATKPQFVFDAATYRWDPNLPIDIPFVSLDSAVFLNGVALREVMEDHLDNFFGVDSNNAVTITYDDVANTMTWKGTDASTTQKGVSSFDSSNFTITAGHVAFTVLDGGTY